MNALGRHLLAEFYDCGTGALDDPARLSGATVVKSVFHAFSPHGVSGVVVVEESHLAVHTWPEYGYAAVDYFSCGEVDCDAAVRYLADHLAPSRVETKEVPRGVIEGSEAPVSAPLASNGGGEASLSAQNGEGRER